MRELGRGRRRGVVAGAAVVLALCFGVVIAPPGGAAAVHGAGHRDANARPAGAYTLTAKHRARKPPTAAQRQALARYLRAHPGAVAAHRRAAGHPARKRPLAKKPKKAKKPANHKKKKKKKKATTSSLHRAVIWLGGLTLGALALFLIGSSLHNGPRSRAKARARARARPVATR